MKMKSVSMYFATALMAFCFPFRSSGAPHSQAAERPPNIIFIMADDLGYGDVGCFGQERFETPHLDELASRGLRLTQHYAGSTVCAPSRCVLMTGQHTGHCPIRGNREVKPHGQYPLEDRAATIAELLQKAGYATGCFGKWGLGYTGTEGDPNNQGFEEFFGYKCQRAAHRYYPFFLWHNQHRVAFDQPAYSQDEIVEQALQFIRNHKDRPFFCYVPSTIPHAALEIPADRHNLFRDQFSEFEARTGKYAGAETTNPIAAFAAMVSQLDGDVGRITSLLDELEIADSTLVIFTSDNGPHSEGGHDPTYFCSSGGLRGIKRDLYEGGIRVPTIVRWPGRVEPGRESAHVSAFWDWLPTFSELAGADTPPGIDGISLVATLFDQPGQKEHEYLYWEFHERGGKQAVRHDRWKAVRLQVLKNPNGPLELYDLKTDPSEATNVASSHPELVAKLERIMEEARQPSDVFEFAKVKRSSRTLPPAYDSDSTSKGS